MTKKILLLVAGQPLAGKDVVGEILRDDHGFTFISTGDVIRRYVEENKLGSKDRSNLNHVSTESRRKFGPAWPVPGVLDEHGHKERLVLAGPRLPAEAEPVVALGGKIIAVDCPIEIRFERAKIRKRVGDGVSFEDFRAIELKETSSADPCAHNLEALLRMAHFIIPNHETPDMLRLRVDEVVRQLA